MIMFVYDDKNEVLYVSEKGSLIEEIKCPKSNNVTWDGLKDMIACISGNWIDENRELGTDFSVSIKIN